MYVIFFFNDTATTDIYTYCHTLSLHDALPIFSSRPVGSPIRVVPPPISTTGLCPVCCKRRSIIIWTRLPTCSDGAVASKPIYPGTTCFAANASSPSASVRSEEHTSELQSLMRISYAVFCLKKKTHTVAYRKLKPEVKL